MNLDPQALAAAALTGQSAAALLMAGVFAMVLYALPTRPARRWVAAWSLLAICFEICGAAQSHTRLEAYLGLLAVFFAAAAMWAMVSGAYAYGAEAGGGIPNGIAVAMFVGTAAALVTAVKSDLLGDLLPIEMLCALTGLLLSLRFFSILRDPAFLGLRITWTASTLLSVTALRTIVAALILYAGGQQLSPIYWVTEIGVTTALGTVFAIGQILALLDLVRLRLHGMNTGLKSTVRELERTARTDSLTGLNNRYAFYALREHADSDDGEHGAAVMLDLDNLKQLNDSHGHDVGDRALVLVADHLRRATRDNDHLFRWGGDEFVVVMPGISLDIAKMRARQMEAVGPLHLPELGIDIPLHLSWGVAPLDRCSPEAALKAADRHLYERRAKRAMGVDEPCWL